MKSRKTARLVCKEWAAQIPMPPRLHLYILGAPVLVEKSIDPQKLQWEAISAERVEASFNSIPQDGFLVFPTYTEAHLYAHKFFSGLAEPNFNNGIRGTQDDGKSFLMGRGKVLYHPVVFEVAYTGVSCLDIKWCSSTILNLGGKKIMRVSAIREPDCKRNLEVLSAKLAIEFIDGKQVELAVLHDSAVQAKQEAEIVDPCMDVPEPESRGRCFLM